jgi:hypothetical protein
MNVAMQENVFIRGHGYESPQQGISLCVSTKQLASDMDNDFH